MEWVVCLEESHKNILLFSCLIQAWASLTLSEKILSGHLDDPKAQQVCRYRGSMWGECWCGDV